jgi:capsular exopolysaccharide synthesis family protein
MLERRTNTPRSLDYGAADSQVDVPSARMGAGIPAANILEILWRRRWIVVGCVVASLICAGIFLARAVPIYSSASQIYIQPGNKALLGDGLGGNTGAANYLQTQCEIIKSTAVLVSALDVPGVANTSSVRSSDNPVGLLKSAIGTQIGKQSDLITVSAESRYPEEAAILANAVVDAYVTYENKVNRSNASEVVKVLQKEKDKQQEEFKANSQAMLQFKRDNGVLSFSEGDKGNIILMRLGELSQAVTTGQLEALQARILAESADALADDPVQLSQFIKSQGNGTDYTAATPMETQANEAEAQLAEMQASFGADYPPAKALAKKVEVLRTRAAQTGNQATSNYVTVAHARAAAAQRRVDELQKAFDEQEKVALSLNSKAAEYEQLQSAQRQTEKLLDVLNTRIKEFHVTENSDAPITISILEVARANPSPVRPNRSQSFGIAVVIGLMLGLGGAMLIDWMDQRIRSTSEVTALLNLTVLGTVPHMVGKATHTERGQAIHLHPTSAVAESYRTIRTGIQFSLPDPSCKTILITSPSPGDGKTTAASNLAIAMAQTGKRVLLIDADCRKPMLHRIFGLKTEVGLSSVLSVRAKLEDAICKCTRDNLDILPCGPVPSNPTEMLNSDPFRTLLSDLAQRYDHIIVDSPPAVMVSDARIVAAVCDVTILVLRAEKTTRRLSTHARDVLDGVGAKIIGVVINDVPNRRSEYGYYSGYGYGYYGSSNGNGSANGDGRSSKAVVDVKHITAIGEAADV